MNHDPKKSKLSTYFYLRCNWIIGSKYKREQAIKRQHNGMISIDHDNAFEYGEYDDTTFNVMLNEMLEHEHGEVVKLRYEGYSNVEIGEILGIHRVTVAKMLSEVKEDCGY